MSDIIITPKDWNFEAVKYNAQPGDRIILTGGSFAEIEFHNLKGTLESPIIVTALTKTVIKGLNAGGRVVQFINCAFIRFTGDPNDDNSQLIEVTGGTQAVDFRELTTDFEVDHLYIHDVGYLGIGGKTDPTCDPKTWRGNFTLRRPRLHHNKIVNIRTGEGLYIGESHYATTFPLTNCASGIKTALEHDVTEVEVYDNIFENIGRDGIQVGAATGGGFIRNNRVTNFGLTKEYGQGSGIQANPGSDLIIEDNIIDGGSNFGIILQGRTGTIVRRNLIKNTIGGIMTVAREATDKGTFQVYNNTFIDITGNGVEYYSNTSFTNNILQMKSGTLVKRYGGLLIDTGNIKMIGTSDQLKLDANYTPLEGSPAFGLVVDAGAFQSVKVTHEPGTIEVETRSGVNSVYVTTPSGRIKLQ
jgi:hypothetical protein